MGVVKRWAKIFREHKYSHNRVKIRHFWSNLDVKGFSLWVKNFFEPNLWGLVIHRKQLFFLNFFTLDIEIGF